MLLVEFTSRFYRARHLEHGAKISGAEFASGAAPLYSCNMPAPKIAGRERFFYELPGHLRFG
jgi:hypothetical protein